jgi:hypothetical protein
VVERSFWRTRDEEKPDDASYKMMGDQAILPICTFHLDPTTTTTAAKFFRRIVCSCSSNIILINPSNKKSIPSNRPFNPSPKCILPRNAIQQVLLSIVPEEDGNEETTSSSSGSGIPIISYFLGGVASFPTSIISESSSSAAATSTSISIFDQLLTQSELAQVIYIGGVSNSMK